MNDICELGRGHVHFLLNDTSEQAGRLDTAKYLWDDHKGVLQLGSLGVLTPLGALLTQNKFIFFSSSLRDLHSSSIHRSTALSVEL